MTFTRCLHAITARRASWSCPRRRRCPIWALPALLAAAALTPTAATADDRTLDLRVTRFADDGESVDMLAGTEAQSLHRGARVGRWTLMEIVPGERPLAVLEDFATLDGRLVLVDPSGIVLDLPKTAESTAADAAGLYFGLTRDEVLASSADLLGDAILSRPGDPEYDDVAKAFAPIRRIAGGVHNFVGTPDNFEKVWFAYGGRSAHFDPAAYQPSIEAIRQAGQVRDGLAGGWLPVLRFVYPESGGAWTEMLAFAPLRIVNGNDRVQPVWYRVTRVERGSVTWSRCFDSYHPAPPRTEDDPRAFYRDLLALRHGWDQILAPAMTVDLPERRVVDLARFSLVRTMMTRVGGYPKYGVVDRNYGNSEHDGFQDTFTVETTAMIAWGLLDQAGDRIDNYFGRFVRDDGSILYRGPQIGQYGRMLTVVAQYAECGGDLAVLLKQRARIDAVATLLLDLRATALELPEGDPAYGLLSGWCEADSALERDPARYIQPYFSNSTEAVRGLGDIGRVWTRIGRERSDHELAAWGERLERAAHALQTDVQRAIERSIRTVDGKPALPAIAGAPQPPYNPHCDPADPQFRAYRAYNEMLYSGILSAEPAGTIVDYRARHHDILLGMPAAYGNRSNELAGFLAYGHGFGLIQADRVREAILMLYSQMAHQYTRGGWLAPETCRPVSGDEAAPYCTPAQLVAPLMLRWMLVFEDPMAETLWLGKAIPRDWLQDGQSVAVTNAPTRWGRVRYTITSRIDSGTIESHLKLPDGGLAAEIRLRLRTPGQRRMEAVTVNGRPWAAFDPAGEAIHLTPGLGGELVIVVKYR